MSTPPEPDLRAGVPVESLADGGIVAGRVDGDEAILVRSGDELFAVGGLCSHYHGLLAQGLVVDATVRCPRHHACFDLRTGDALRAPALDPIACWRVERIGDMAFVRERLPGPQEKASRLPAPSGTPTPPESVVIVGGGAAGLACADMLRREGYPGPLTIVSADDSSPCDRPNLSKDYLAGTALDEWMPLRPDDYYPQRRIDLQLNATVVKLDAVRRELQLDDGQRLGYGALLLATGAESVRLDIPGASPGQVLPLHSFADARAIVARVADARNVLVVGASFIGLEVAASLRSRGVQVHVVAPGRVPMEKVLGADVGAYLQRLHESRGVVFHLGTTVRRIDGAVVMLEDGTAIEADLVVTGVGVRPVTGLAEAAGLKTDRGLLVDEFLQTSAAGVYAAGDIVRWPDPHSGERIRVEHWNVAQRQGQVAALNMLGRRRPFDAVPFFWSQHYDVEIHYLGHAEAWDTAELDGSFDRNDWSVTYRRADRVTAIATMSRQLQTLKTEHGLETALR